MISRTVSSLELKMSPVDSYDLNGKFVKYNARCWLGSNLSATVDTNETNVTISGLGFAFTFNVSVAAVSTGGVGVYSPFHQATTAQDCKDTNKPLRLRYYCLEMGVRTEIKVPIPYCVKRP